MAKANPTIATFTSNTGASRTGTKLGRWTMLSGNQASLIN